MVTLKEIWNEDEKILGCSRSDILSKLPRRLSHSILKWAEISPHAPAVVGNATTLTYAALQQAVLRLRGYALLVPSLFPAKANHAQGQS